MHIKSLYKHVEYIVIKGHKHSLKVRKTHARKTEVAMSVAM